MGKVKIEYKGNFTVMDNTHLRDKRLSLAAIGLMDKMLSLPENWDYTITGLTAICKEGKSSIASKLSELEDCGYLVRSQIRTSKGKFQDIDYVLVEAPYPKNPYPGFPDTDNRPQLNTNKLNINELNTEYISKKNHYCKLKQTYNGIIDEHCAECFHINKCPFPVRLSSNFQNMDPFNLTDSEVENMMEQIFLFNANYSPRERKKNNCWTELEKKYYLEMD